MVTSGTLLSRRPVKLWTVRVSLSCTERSHNNHATYSHNGNPLRPFRLFSGCWHLRLGRRPELTRRFGYLPRVPAAGRLGPTTPAPGTSKPTWPGLIAVRRAATNCGAQSPFNRVATPEEIAAAVVYLASPEAEWPPEPSST